MPGPIDDTLKHLTELSPQDWVVQGGWTAAPATLIDADIATITGATDKVIRVAGPRDAQAVLISGQERMRQKDPLEARALPRPFWQSQPFPLPSICPVARRTD